MGSLTPGQVVFETLLRLQDEATAARRRKADMAEACRMGFGADPEVLQRFLDDNRG